MDIQLEKIELMKILLDIEDPSMIKAVKKVLTKEKKDWWEDLTDTQKESIAQSELEYERGEFSSFEEVMKKHR